MFPYSDSLSNKMSDDRSTYFESSPYTQVLIKLENVGISLDDFCEDRIEDINWEIKTGERWIVSGFHGSGKTNLLKVAAGLKECAGGKISILGSTYWGDTEENICEIRKQIAFIFEDGDRLLQRLTVTENMALPLCYHENKTIHELKEPIQKILDYLGLQSIGCLYPSQLNLYQKQCVLLGRAILIKPKLFFVDNPGEGFDIVQKYKIKSILDDISKGIPSLDLPGATIVVSTQRLQDYLENYSGDSRNSQNIPWMYAVISNQKLHIFQTIESLRMSEDTTIKKIIGKWSKV